MTDRSLAITLALIGIIVPTVAQINSCKEQELARIAKAKDIELAQQEHDLKRQVEFLDRAVNPEHSAESRQQVLRFLRDVSNDNATKSWAVAELGPVEQEVKEREELRRQLEQSQAEAALLQDSVAELEGELKQSQTDAAKADKLKQELVNAKHKLDKVQTRRVETEQRLSPPTGSREQSVLLIEACQVGTISGRQENPLSVYMVPVIADYCLSSFGPSQIQSVDASKMIWSVTSRDGARIHCDCVLREGVKLKSP